MLPQKFVQAAHHKVSLSSVMTGAALSFTLLAEYRRCMNQGEGDLAKDGDGFNKGDDFGSRYGSPNVTSCEFFYRGRPRVSRLARSKTIRQMKDTSTKETLRSKYDVQRKTPLGEGGFGAVYLATDRNTKELVAVKKISKRFTDDASFQKEMNAFLRIRQCGGHPHIACIP